MKIFEKYSEYYKDNPNGYWFKRKLYGWGWTPVKWQGWLVIVLYVSYLVYVFRLIDSIQHSGSDTLINFAPLFILSSVILIYICYKKGEKPKWQWGPEEHYVCLGGCRGVSKVPGVCQAPNCVNHNHELVKCNCTDGLHYNFDPSKF